MNITLDACFSGYHHSQVETDGPFWEDDRLLFGGPEAHLTFPLSDNLPNMGVLGAVLHFAVIVVTH